MNLQIAFVDGPTPVAWADVLGRMGYIALAIDSFQPRGLVKRCTAGFQEQALDAWQAHWLAYDYAATRDACKQVRQLFHQTLPVKPPRLSK